MSKRNFHPPRTKRKILDRNWSARNPGSKIVQIALHTTESHPRPGVGDVSGLWDYFNRPGTEASAHIIAQGKDSWQAVPDESKAWTIGAANSWTLNIEQIGFAAYSFKQWMSGDNYRTLRTTAKTIAYWHRKYGIPITQGSVQSVGGVLRPNKHGVIRHSDVTAAGFGTHTDPGKSYPFRTVLRWARWYAKHGWIT